MAAPLKRLPRLPSTLELLLAHLDLCDLVFDFLDEESIKNLSLTSHSIAEKCSMMYPIRRSLRLQGLAPAILANNTAFSSSLATPALGNSGNTLSTPSGSGFDSGNELVASTENRRRSPMDLSGGDEKTDSEFESEDDKEYRAQLQVNPEVVASIVQNFPQANTTASLTGLPTELTIMIFGNLDVIDAVCLGLASRRHYNIYSLLFGYGVKLNTRRIGQPGTVERSWEVVGKDQCAHCGSYRCQLYRHINTWMGPNLEYCLLKENFGSCAKEGARETCYRNKPSKPRRCGRHPVRTTTMHQDDTFFSYIRPYPV